MLMFSLTISSLTASNLPWFMNLTFQIPMQYCTYSLRLYFHHQSLPQLGLFLLWLHLFILSWVISPLISSSILGTYRPGEFIFQCPFFCLFILFMGFSRQEYWSSLPFPSPLDDALSELSTMTHLSWLSDSFLELDKAVVHVIRLVSFLWLWFLVNKTRNRLTDIENKLEVTSREKEGEGAILGWGREKVKVLISQSCLTLYNGMECSHQAPLSMEFSRQEHWRG